MTLIVEETRRDLQRQIMEAYAESMTARTEEERRAWKQRWADLLVEQEVEFGSRGPAIVTDLGRPVTG